VAHAKQASGDAGNILEFVRAGYSKPALAMKHDASLMAEISGSRLVRKIFRKTPYIKSRRL
jgi:hypothetical protein